MNKIYFIILFINIFVIVVNCKSIFDYFDDDSLEARDEPPPNVEDQKNNCSCTGHSCSCCIDFNISSLFDFGRPACIDMKYLSPDEGISMNISYGDSLLHTGKVNVPDPKPICLNIFTSIAKMCARFSELLPTDDGFRGCLTLEPILLEESQIELPIGCFRMSSNGMETIESANDQIKEHLPTNQTIETSNEDDLNNDIDTDGDGDDDGDDDDQNTTESSAEETLAGYNTDEILAAVNESAEQGIALLSNWLGLNLGSSQTSKPIKNKNVTDVSN